MDAAQKKTVIEAHAKHEGDTGSICSVPSSRMQLK